MNKRRIIYISKYALTPANSFCTRQFYLAKALASQGYDCTIISSMSCGYESDYSDYQKKIGQSLSKDYDGLEHVFIRGIGIKLGMNAKRIWSWCQFEWRLYKYLSSEVIRKDDVVIVSSLSLLTVINGLITKRVNKCKLVFEIRDIWPLTLIEVGGMSPNNLFVRFLAWIEKLGYRNADLVVGSMPGLNEHILRTINREVNFLYLPMGYDDGKMRSDITFTNRLGDHKQRSHLFTVCYSGSIGRVNKVEEILKTAKILYQLDKKVVFRIIGDGPFLVDLKKKYSNLSNVVFVPWLNKHELHKELIKADLLLHPIPKKGLYRFGVSPNKWIDYMLSSKPVLLAYSGYRSILEDAGCAFVVEPDDPAIVAKAILDIRKLDSTFLTTMGHRGRVYLLENLGYERLSKKLISEIEGLFA